MGVVEIEEKAVFEHYTLQDHPMGNTEKTCSIINFNI